MSVRDQWREAWMIARLTAADDAPEAFATWARRKLQRTFLGACVLRLLALREGLCG